MDCSDVTVYSIQTELRWCDVPCMHRRDSTLGQGEAAVVTQTSALFPNVTLITVCQTIGAFCGLQNTPKCVTARPRYTIFGARYSTPPFSGHYPEILFLSNCAWPCILTYCTTLPIWWNTLSTAVICIIMLINLVKLSVDKTRLPHVRR